MRVPCPRRASTASASARSAERWAGPRDVEGLPRARKALWPGVARGGKTRDQRRRRSPRALPAPLPLARCGAVAAILGPPLTRAAQRLVGAQLSRAPAREARQASIGPRRRVARAHLTARRRVERADDWTARAGVARRRADELAARPGAADPRPVGTHEGVLRAGSPGVTETAVGAARADELAAGPSAADDRAIGTTERVSRAGGAGVVTGARGKRAVGPATADGASIRTQAYIRRARHAAAPLRLEGREAGHLEADAPVRWPRVAAPTRFRRPRGAAR